MFRRSTTSLVRRTPVLLSGGELYHPLKLSEIPPGSSTPGMFGHNYNNGLEVLRFIDIKWIMNRCVEMGRDHYLAAPTLFFFLWMFCWNGFVMMRYGDGKPPRNTNWNTEEAGYLPDDFQPTIVSKKL